jgi:hypothetical protein
MVSQQVHYQFKWLNVFEHTWACPFAICYLLFAITLLAPLGYRRLRRAGTRALPELHPAL